jgi:hypothetical protein
LPRGGQHRLPQRKVLRKSDIFDPGLSRHQKRYKSQTDVVKLVRGYSKSQKQNFVSQDNFEGDNDESNE